MRGETIITLGFGVFALLLGGWLTRVRSRHLARVRVDRDAGRYIPLIDARGVWLFLNGPVTAVLGAGLLTFGAVRGRMELEEARLRRELGAIELSCSPGAMRVALRGEDARVIELAMRVRRDGYESGVPVRTSSPARLALEPGGSQTLEISLADASACGEELTADEALANSDALERAYAEDGSMNVAVLFAFGDIEPIAPRGPWPRCSGYSGQLVVRDPEGVELARGEKTCTFPGRATPLLFDPTLYR